MFCDYKAVGLSGTFVEHAFFKIMHHLYNLIEHVEINSRIYSIW
jgi:hypothetical protein